MGIAPGEKIQRQYLEKRHAAMRNEGAVKAVDSRDDIRQQAIDAFAKQLDGRLKNLQEGEYLQINFRIDIVMESGKIRGGSGSQRNMPEYIEWRDAVYQRDNYTCQHCGKRGKLNAHHIKGWAGHSELRFDVSNGITLCEDCHAEVHPHIKLLSKKRN